MFWIITASGKMAKNLHRAVRKEEGKSKMESHTRHYLYKKNPRRFEWRERKRKKEKNIKEWRGREKAKSKESGKEGVCGRVGAILKLNGTRAPRPRVTGSQPVVLHKDCQDLGGKWWDRTPGDGGADGDDKGDGDDDNGVDDGDGDSEDEDGDGDSEGDGDSVDDEGDGDSEDVMRVMVIVRIMIVMVLRKMISEIISVRVWMIKW